MYQIKFSKQLAFNIIFSLLFLYFAFHSIFGNRGINSYFQLKTKTYKAYEELTALRAERVEVEHKAKLLKEGDPDILDQYAKEALGLAKSNEKVFLIKE